MDNNIELTILMPCLNEEETLAECIQNAKTFLINNNVAGEVLIADNGSNDGSVMIAETSGARVVHIKERGYGAALIGGCNFARGKYVIMGDADNSYDFLNLIDFLEKLRDGYDLVMGNRFKGGIEDGAMPWLHRYVGNPFLSFVGRLLFPSEIGDFHCGLRGYKREAILKLGLETTGMEYASEMVVKCTFNKYKVIEVPTILRPDGRSRKPHLRSFRDGWRHLKFILKYRIETIYQDLSKMKKLFDYYQKSREIINYLIVGGLTTVVSLATYYLCVLTFLDPNHPVQLQVANICSWVVAVTFAFFTNRKFVFQSTGSKLKEGTAFFASRLTTLGMDMACMFIMVTLLGINDKIAKLIVQVIVTVGNYILSKYFVFKNEN